MQDYVLYVNKLIACSQARSNSTHFSSCCHENKSKCLSCLITSNILFLHISWLLLAVFWVVVVFCLFSFHTLHYWNVIFQPNIKEFHAIIWGKLHMAAWFAEKLPTIRSNKVLCCIASWFRFASTTNYCQCMTGKSANLVSLLKSSKHPEQ